MDTLQYVIVESKQDYNNEVELAGKKIVVNTTIESVSNINREATVISTPKGTILQEGDTVILHHNIMRRKNNTAGKEVRSNFYLKDNKYFVPLTEVFAYKRGEDSWKAIDPFCFVEPIKLEKKEVSGILIREEDQGGFKNRVNGEGILKYINKELEEVEGLSIGDRVVFTPFSEHEFEIDGQVLYKMKTSDILAVK